MANEMLILLARTQAELRKERDRVVKECEERMAKAKDAYYQAEETLGRAMQRAQVPKFTVEGVGSFSVRTSFQPKVLDKAKVTAFLENDPEGKNLLKWDFNANSFKAFVNERMREGTGALPPADAVDVASFTRVVAGFRAEGGSSSDE
jgi:hypothetical protein